MPRIENAVKLVVVSAALTGLLAPGAYAQDPPSRVARLSDFSGRVSMEPAGMDDWSPAEINRPFTTGDYLWTDSNSRATLHSDNAAMRLDERSVFGFLNLDDRNTQIKFSQGELNIRLRGLEQDEVFEVDTPNAAISLLREGEYTIRVVPEEESSYVIVRRGEAEATGGGQTLPLHEGDAVRLGGSESLAYDFQDAPPLSSFERWCEDREARAERAASARYLPPDVIGYEDLDDYGSWRDDSEYGPVWVPAVSAGWAPYRYGHWAWIDPWGWTWVDNARWGFAPFHYGRWAYLSSAWCWVPGPLIVHRRLGMGRIRPIYSPALVAFVGGDNWSVSFAVGRGPAVGWVPLGPGEVYTPGYRMSSGYFHRINVANTAIHRDVNIVNIYNTTYVGGDFHGRPVNRRLANMVVRDAVTVMPHDDFSRGHRSARPGIALRGAELDRLRNAPAFVAPRAAPVRPVVAPRREPGVTAPPDRAMRSRVIVRQAPPAPAASPTIQRRAPAIRIAPPARRVEPAPRVERQRPVVQPERRQAPQIERKSVQPRKEAPPKREGGREKGERGKRSSDR
jgi:hypothetical protein